MPGFFFSPAVAGSASLTNPPVTQTTVMPIQPSPDQLYFVEPNSKLTGKLSWSTEKSGFLKKRPVFPLMRNGKPFFLAFRTSDTIPAFPVTLCQQLMAKKSSTDEFVFDPQNDVSVCKMTFGSDMMSSFRDLESQIETQLYPDNQNRSVPWSPEFRSIRVTDTAKTQTATLRMIFSSSLYRSDIKTKQFLNTHLAYTKAKQGRDDMIAAKQASELFNPLLNALIVCPLRRHNPESEFGPAKDEIFFEIKLARQQPSNLLPLRVGEEPRRDFHTGIRQMNSSYVPPAYLCDAPRFHVNDMKDLNLSHCLIFKKYVCVKDNYIQTLLLTCDSCHFRLDTQTTDDRTRTRLTISEKQHKPLLDAVQSIAKALELQPNISTSCSVHFYSQTSKDYPTPVMSSNAAGRNPEDGTFFTDEMVFALAKYSDDVNKLSLVPVSLGNFHPLSSADPKIDIPLSTSSASSSLSCDYILQTPSFAEVPLTVSKVIALDHLAAKRRMAFLYHASNDVEAKFLLNTGGEASDLLALKYCDIEDGTEDVLDQQQDGRYTNKMTLKATPSECDLPALRDLYDSAVQSFVDKISEEFSVKIDDAERNCSWTENGKDSDGDYRGSNMIKIDLAGYGNIIGADEFNRDQPISRTEFFNLCMANRGENNTVNLQIGVVAKMKVSAVISKPKKLKTERGSVQSVTLSKLTVKFRAEHICVRTPQITEFSFDGLI